ncbi:putative acetyltransferase [Antarctobacter heliothermus]|uniref:Putative acetyltransferase n=1 Tax=Antarctobacter heliothermus TaxID=74033 RepID=A0A222EAC9_9RHOB|nr:GNAT family N-acetyltransferase [Antarctobacter heliothermus]ASP23153.1 putative acetyltransferase [Antarctobacter heliothermus]
MNRREITLRPAQPGDAGKLGAMITEAVEAHAWKPRLHSAAQDIAHTGKMIDRGWVTVAELGSAVAAFIARDGNEVDALFVATWAQGQGLGTALLEDAKTHTDRLELWTFQENTGAQRFYLQQGFDEVARTDGDKNEEGLPDIRYLWQRPTAPLPEQST